MRTKALLFGGNRKNEQGPLMHFIRLLKKSEIDVVVFSDPIHLHMKLSDDQSLEEVLIKEKVVYFECNVLDKTLLSTLIDKDTIGLSFNSSWIFKKDIIELFNGKLYNYHNARLPEEQGAAAYSWKILQGSYLGELNFHKVEIGIDEGEVVYSHAFEFSKECKTCSDFLSFMEGHEQQLFANFLQDYLLDENQTVTEDNHKRIERSPYYWPKLDTNIHGFVNWDWFPNEILLFVNAFGKPHPGASAFYEGKRVYFHEVEIVEAQVHFHPFQAGLIFRKDQNGISIAARGGSLFVRVVLNEAGENIVSKLKLGRRFYTPIEYLERAKRARVVFKGDSMEIKEF